MAAFSAAIALGCEGAELDVQLSADGVVMVHHDFQPQSGHDPQCWRLADRRNTAIKNLSFSELQNYDLGRPDPASDYARGHPGAVPKDGAIPTLEAVVARPSRTPFPFCGIEMLGRSGVRRSGSLADAALAVMKITSPAPFSSASTGAGWRGSKARGAGRAMLVHHRQTARRCGPALDIIRPPAAMAGFPDTRTPRPTCRGSPRRAFRSAPGPSTLQGEMKR